MNTRRFITTAILAIVVLIGISSFVVYDMRAPVKEVRVYEVPESRQVQRKANVIEIADNPTLPQDISTLTAEEKAAKIEQLRAEIEQLDAETEQLRAETEQLRQETAEANRRSAAALQRIAEAKRVAASIKDGTHPLIVETRELVYWIENDFTPRFAAAADEAGHLVVPHMTRETFVEMYPDPADQAYYIQKLQEIVGLHEELATRIANASPDVREASIEGFRRVWTVAFGKDVTDDFLAEISQRITN